MATCKSFLVQSPDGTVEKIDYLGEYCRRQGLRSGALYLGKRKTKTYKNYTVTLLRNRLARGDLEYLDQRHPDSNIDDDDDGLWKPDPKTRRCLRCRDEFRSTWAGNRICSRCSNSPMYTSSDMG